MKPIHERKPFSIINIHIDFENKLLIKYIQSKDCSLFVVTNT